MSETVTIARPYAQAVFRLARESSSLPLWSDRLQRLALLVVIVDPLRSRTFVGRGRLRAGHAWQQRAANEEYPSIHIVVPVVHQLEAPRLTAPACEEMTSCSSSSQRDAGTLCSSIVSSLSMRFM